MGISSKEQRVLISDKMSPVGVDWLTSQEGVQVDYRPGLSPEELAECIGDYAGLVIRSGTKVTADILEAATQLKVVGRAGIGVDNVDVPEATRRGVLVMNEPSGNNVTTAELAIALLVSLSRNIPQAHASMKERRWEKSRFTGMEITGRTLGVVGLGNIGKLVAERARGLKLEVIAHDPFVTEAAAAKVGAKLVPFDDLLERSDFITVHTPLLPQTRGLLGSAAFEKMKDGVRIINAARGGVVDEEALLAALESGKVRAAALDVFVSEPPPADDPLVGHANVVCTPHLGASTVEAQDRVAVDLCRQIVAFLKEGEITNAVNLPRVPPAVQGRLQAYIGLGRRMGRFLGRVAGSVQGVEVTCQGSLFQEGQAFVTRAVLQGVLSAVSERPVNLVNAAVIAEEMGWTTAEAYAPAEGAYAELVTVRIRSGAGGREASGSVFGDVARMVSLDGVRLEANLDGHLLVLTNADQPGVIGNVGMRLGESSINIARCQVGLPPGGGTATSIWSVDQAIPDEVLAELRDLPHVQDALQMFLG